MFNKKRSFFEKLTGSGKIEDKEPEKNVSLKTENGWMEESAEEGQLTVDVYQTPTDIIIKSIVAGVKPEDLDVSISHEMITIRGKREDSLRVEKESYFYQELYWGSFSRSVLLPQEVDPDEAEANLKGGILTIRLPKLNKERVHKLKIKGE
jgi:HSP20 family protein